MLHQFPFYLAILLVIVFLVMLANKIKIAYPILLVLGGLLISFVPGIPRVHIDPELIFIIFLPPLLYEAAWATTWKELWRWRRIIGSFAFLIVFLTAFAVALVSSKFIPGFTLALGFLLGGIVSPPDAVSAGAILKFVKIPKRLASILEGESLLNDASSLIVFRFALVAVGTGQFVFEEAIASFAWAVAGGAAIGLAIAFVFYKTHKLLPTDVNMDIVLSLVTPYVMYIAAESAETSGVLSVVCGGLFLAQQRHRFLSSTSRLRAVNVWESLVFILNGLVFMLIGLDLPEITDGLEEVSMGSAIGYGMMITALLVVGRLLSAYGAVVFTQFARRFITVAEQGHPGYRGPFLLGWAGMRGVVSLAAALSIPPYLADGTPFPQRNHILFITFIVILLTLVIQGLTLPVFIRRFNLQDTDHEMSEEEEYRHLHKRLADDSLVYLRNREVADDANQFAVGKMLKQLENTNTLLDDEQLTRECREVYLHMLDVQRSWLKEWNREFTTNDDAVRKHLHRLDVEEEKIRFM